MTDSADRTSARIRLEHATLGLLDGTTQFVEVTYDTAAKTMSTSYGLSPAPTTVPAKTTIDLTIFPGAVEVMGAYVWNRPVSSIQGLTPRHHALRTGDIEVFQMRSRRAAPSYTVQNTASLPVELGPTVGPQPSGSFFSDYSYAQSVTSYLRTLVRDPTFNPDCTVAGDAFRQAFATIGQSPPLSVEQAPANLCIAHAAFADAKVDQIIDDTCRANIDIILSVTDGNGAASNVNLCTHHHEGVLLANPQYSFVNPDQRRVLALTPEQRSPEHVAIAAELAARPLQNLAPLATTTWAPLAVRPAADFKGAENRP